VGSAGLRLATKPGARWWDAVNTSL